MAKSIWPAAAMSLGLAIAPGIAAAASPFDGSWSVVVTCAQAKDGAKGYIWRFLATVRDGTLTGQFNQPGAVPSGTLTGQIQPDGDALLYMNGRSGHEDYTVGRVQPGTPIHYTVKTHFDGRAGAGKRVELRDCDLTFDKLRAQ